VNLDKHDENGSVDHPVRRTYSTSAPATTNCLLGNFEVQTQQSLLLFLLLLSECSKFVTICFANCHRYMKLFDVYQESHKLIE